MAIDRSKKMERRIMKNIMRLVVASSVTAIVINILMVFG